MRNMRIFPWILSAALLTGCGAVSSGGGDSAMGAGYVSEESAEWNDEAVVLMNRAADADVNESADDSDSGALTDNIEAADATAEDRKLVTTMQISMESKEFDKAYAGIKAKVKELGGWIAGDYLSSSYRYVSADQGGEVRYASLSLRIPAEKLDNFLEYAASETNVTSKSATTEDVTLQYTDLSAKIEVKETEVSRLKSFMEEAATVEDMLAIEERLSDAQYELDSAKSQRKILAGRITYSEISVNLQEVLVYTETQAKSDLQRIRDGFLQNLEDVFFELKELFIAFVTHLPALALLAFVLFVLIRCIRKLRHAGKRKPKKKRQNVPDDSQSKDEKMKTSVPDALQSREEKNQTSVPESAGDRGSCSRERES